ncbi:MAG: choice-of-anchor V domain-containing protein [Thermoplasmatota archaeon]
MTPSPASAQVRKWLPALLLTAVAVLAASPLGAGFSSGIHNGNAPDPAAFEEEGCVACHGDHTYAVTDGGIVSWSITDADGVGIAGNAYEADAVYTITIKLMEQNAPEADNHAGFNIRASAGTFEGVDGNSQPSDDGTQATHVDPASTQWTVTWTAPHDGVAVFDLLVNDVDGSGAADATDEVHRVGWYLTDSSHALPGAAAHGEEHKEFGVSLQQYWIGLVALTGMAFIMAFTYVYMRYSNPHNTDKKDR